MHIPTLKQLKYLVELERHGHFGRAAEACFVTQSTLSAGIQELENLLGCKLVERTKRRVLFTELGNDIVERSLELLRGAEDIATMARHSTETLSGDLKLGAIPTIAPYLLPQTLPRLRKEYRDLKLYLVEDETSRLIDRLQAGTIDAALMAFPYNEASLEWIELAEDPFLLAHPVDHPIATMDAVQRNRLLQSQALQSQLILLEEGHCLRDHALAVCHMTTLKPGQTLQASSLLTLVHMVANGLGVTLLPALSCQSSLLSGTNVALTPLEGNSGHRKLGLAWRKSSVRKKDLKLLADQLAQTAQKQISSFLSKMLSTK